MNSTHPIRATLQFPRGHCEVLVQHCKGNRAARRVLSLFQSVRPGTLAPGPAFASAWRDLCARHPGTVELLAYRMAKLSNRPLDRVCPPSWQVCNNWLYEPESWRLAVKPI